MHEKLVVATDSLDDAALVRQGINAILGSRAAVMLSTSYPPKRRARLLRQFREEESPRVLVLSVRSAGMGVNLQRANHVIMLDNYMDRNSRSQLVGRVHRLGQTRPVTIHSVRFADTLDGTEGFERGEGSMVRVRTLLIEALQREIDAVAEETGIAAAEEGAAAGGGGGGGSEEDR